MCKECGWEEIIEEINDHLSDEDFEWAEDTLAGIANTIQEREHVTEGQVNYSALKNGASSFIGTSKNKRFSSIILSDSASTRSTDDPRRYGSIDSIYRNNNESKLYSSVPALKSEVLRIQGKKIVAVTNIESAVERRTR